MSIAMQVSERPPPSAVSGEPDFESLFTAHWRPIYLFMARRVGHETAEEIAAQTFETALQNQSSFDPSRGSERAWLFGIALNLSRRHLRGESRRLRAYSRNGVSVNTEETDEVIGALDARCQAPALAKALAQLKRNDRDALLLLAWGELTYEEIAIATDVPLGTVRSRLNRARRVISAHLANDQFVAEIEPQEAF